MKTWLAVMAAVAGVAGGARAQEAWRWQQVALVTNGWHAARISIDAEAGGGLAVRQSDEHNGFLVPLASRQRRTLAVEADLVVRERLCKAGWNFAGVTLCQDDGNLWLLALVEGPDGKRSVDFLESIGGVWQAQNEEPTRLKREGGVTFDWKPDTGYRLRLELADGKVTAHVSETAGGRVWGAAAYAPRRRRGRRSACARRGRGRIRRRCR